MTTYHVLDCVYFSEPRRYEQRYHSDSLTDCITYIKTLPIEEHHTLFVMKDVCYPMGNGSIVVKGEGDTWFDAK